MYYNYVTNSYWPALFLLYIVFESSFWNNKLKDESKNEEERNNL